MAMAEVSLLTMRTVVSEPCESRLLLTGTVCGEPSTGLYRGACVHEHVRERRLCTRHASITNLWCRVCFDIDGAQAHKCNVTLMPGEAARAAGAED
jgi:hypothetical protein